MAQVSKYRIPSKVYERIFEIFLKSLAEIKSKNEAEAFIKDFLTPTERIMLAKRLAIAFLLEKDYDFRTISMILRVSTSTVGRVNLARKYGSKGYQKVIKKILQEEKLTKFFLEAAEVLSGSLGKSTKGGGAWRYLHHKLKKKKKKRPF